VILKSEESAPLISLNALKHLSFLIASILTVSCAWSQQSDRLSHYGIGNIDNFAVAGDSIVTQNDDYLFAAPVFGGEWGDRIPSGSIFLVQSRFLEKFSGTRRASGLAGWIWYEIEFVSPDRKDTTMGWINSASSRELRWDLAEAQFDERYSLQSNTKYPPVWFLFIVLWLGSAFLVGNCAAQRDESQTGFFLLSLAFSPLVGFAVLLIMANKKH
jgi:hypothetical protein